jgi:hypothetical protein
MTRLTAESAVNAFEVVVSAPNPPIVNNLSLDADNASRDSRLLPRARCVFRNFATSVRQKVESENK